MHDAFNVGSPLIAILGGILLNRSDNKELRAEMRAGIAGLRLEMNARFDRVDAEFRYFHGHVGKLEGRIESIEKR